MAYRVTNGAGTNFNTAANWDEGVNSPTVHASTSITVTSGGVTSATFTAPNTTNACTGVLVPVAAVGTAGTITAQLQENSAGWVDVASANYTLNITSLRASTLVFFEFTTPYVFAATTAGYYRIKLSTSGASGTTSIAADSGGSNFSYLATMNNNVVPTTSDDVIFVSPNQGSELAISLDTSPSIGSGTNTSTAAFRSWGNALTFANNGVLSWPTSTSRTLTCKGNILLENAGELRIGSTGAKIATGTLARLAFDQNGVTCNYGITHLNGGKFILQGTSLTYKSTTVSSGSGTSGSPLVTTDTTGWSVNDELVFVPVSNNAANYDESETRFIRTIAGTSITLSATAGGAESGLTYSHTAGYVFNLTRSVLIDTTDTTKAWYADFNEITTIGNIDLDGCRLETTGSGVAGRTTITFSSISTELFTTDDVVFYRQAGTQGITFGNNNDTRTYTWLIFYDCNVTGNAGALFISSMRNKRFENCYAVDSTTRGFFMSAASACDFVDCGAWACGRTTTTSGGFGYQNASNIFLETCEAHANRGPGNEIATMPILYAFECQFGNKGYNQGNDIAITSDNFATALFESCLFGSPTTISNYTNAADGTDISFQEFNQTANNHLWYTKYGSARSTGAGLPDTNVRTPGSLGLRIAPENATTGFSWQFRILANADSAVSIFGFIQKNAAFGTDDCDVELYLPGLVPGVSTPSDTQAMPDNTSWNVFNLAANYTGSVPLFATVRVVAKTTTSAAYVYVDDLYNGTNEITAFDVWYQGKPSEFMYAELGDPSAVWAVSTTTLTTPQTTGKQLVDALTTGKFIALK